MHRRHDACRKNVYDKRPGAFFGAPLSSPFFPGKVPGSGGAGLHCRGDTLVLEDEENPKMFGKHLSTLRLEGQESPGLAIIVFLLYESGCGEKLNNLQQTQFWVNVWCSIIHGTLLGPHFYDGTLNENGYLEVLSFASHSMTLNTRGCYGLRLLCPHTERNIGLGWWIGQNVHRMRVIRGSPTSPTGLEPSSAHVVNTSFSEGWKGWVFNVYG
ncbi:hypothetical protein WH47_02786 [Habropoda laboriosa]|uniref:Uncharacterized protein n=1 Tax=Habropoda laboriosa TaxID=597456 RepID=A0A0L7QYR7_9HYME|nr:hypothetical protein WH47_02786 [Habropoda laboriosa]